MVDVHDVAHAAKVVVEKVGAIGDTSALDTRNVSKGVTIETIADGAIGLGTIRKVIGEANKELKVAKTENGEH